MPGSIEAAPDLARESGSYMDQVGAIRKEGHGCILYIPCYTSQGPLWIHTLSTPTIELHSLKGFSFEVTSITAYSQSKKCVKPMTATDMIEIVIRS